MITNIEYFSLLKIILIKIIKNGFINSIGWNLGNKYKSIHLFDPLTSTPKNGTRNKNKIERKKTTIEILNKFSWLIAENVKIIPIPKIIKIKCLKKNE